MKLCMNLYANNCSFKGRLLHYCMEHLVSVVWFSPPRITHIHNVNPVMLLDGCQRKCAHNPACVYTHHQCGWEMLIASHNRQLQAESFSCGFISRVYRNTIIGKTFELGHFRRGYSFAIFKSWWFFPPSWNVTMFPQTQVKYGQVPKIYSSCSFVTSYGFPSLIVFLQNRTNISFSFNIQQRFKELILQLSVLWVREICPWHRSRSGYIIA